MIFNVTKGGRKILKDFSHDEIVWRAVDKSLAMNFVKSDDLTSILREAVKLAVRVDATLKEHSEKWIDEEIDDLKRRKSS